MSSWVNVDLPLKLGFVEIRILTNFLTPTSLIVKVYISTLSCFASLQLRFLSLPKPCVVLFMEHPVFLLEFHRGKVLLLSPLLEIEGKKQSFKVKAREALSPIIERQGGEKSIVHRLRHSLARRVYLLVPRFRQISV
jgi:hypothetical protein